MTASYQSGMSSPSLSRNGSSGVRTTAIGANAWLDSWEREGFAPVEVARGVPNALRTEKYELASRIPACPTGAFNTENAGLTVSVIPAPVTGEFSTENAGLSISVNPAPVTGEFKTENAVLSVSVIPAPVTGEFRTENALLSVSVSPAPVTGEFKIENAVLSVSGAA